MKKKGILLSATLALAFILIISASPQLPDDTEFEISEQTPPALKHFWIQKLTTPLQDGSNLLVMLEYEEGSILPETLDLYPDGTENSLITFHDDGLNGDATEDDGIYSAYMTENLTDLVSNIQDMITELGDDGGYFRFEGHVGEKVTDITEFDANAFDVGDVVELDRNWLNVIKCDWNLVKEKTLFITDLSVVEDPARTYNVVTNTGNPWGIWTFGNLMKKIANNSSTNATKTFLKTWLDCFMNNQSINGQTIGARDRYRFVKLFIAPWLAKCGVTGVDETNWQTKWGAASESNLLAYAPFKLTAIVNRIDLRGSSAYTAGMGNTGETRFIYSLVYVGANEGVNVTGKPPVHDDQDFAMSGSFLDWEGMNVIFEYGNVQTDICQVKTFAQSWLALSGMTLGTSTYNDALEDLTETVINANAAPTKTNGSAINRIRTNEKIFSGGRPNWSDDHWELRQFELDPSSGQLMQVPVTNTPRSGSNYAYFISPSSYMSAQNTSFCRNLIDWVFAPLPKLLIEKERHSVPLSFSYTGDKMLAGSAVVDAGFATYYDLKWDETTNNYDYNIIGSSNPAEKKLRRNLSLNTCQGCHTGETKTIFAHVLPLGYGQSAEYWNPTPDNVVRTIDTRFFDNWGSSSLGNNYTTPSGNRTFSKVSAFLTGRNYSGNPTSFDDDDGSDADDSNMEGLYYVNDPTNGLIGPPTRWGYNDLKRRKDDLCQLMGLDCSGGVLGLLKAVKHQPLPAGSH